MLPERKIRNQSELARSASRTAILDIVEAGLAAIDTRAVIQRNVRAEDFAESKRLFVVGIGKCSLEAGAALEDILGDRITAGIVVDVHEGTLKKIRTFAGTHPFPSERNIEATRAIIEMLTGLTVDDTVLFVISGGGSTLLCQPNNFTCIDERNIMECLMKNGADIYAVNTLRKHLSYARGGFLAHYAYPARVTALLFSDVPGNKLEFIASGPTMKDSTTVEDARRVISGNKVAPACVFLGDHLIETPKDDRYFARVENRLVVSNSIALEAMSAKAIEIGLDPRIVTDELTGEARDRGVDIAREISNTPTNTVLLYGGETTVTVKRVGRGGRNQELVLSALSVLPSGCCIAGIASDGRDNGSFAGAIGDELTLARASELDMAPVRFLDDNSSEDFFEKVRDHIVTGDTGSNVSDLVIAIKK